MNPPTKDERLPAEIWEEVLFLLPSHELVNLCSTNRVYRNLCSSGSFWRERFRREGLPLFFLQKLSEAASFSEFVKVYQKTLHDVEKRDEFLPTNSSVHRYERRVAFIRVVPETDPDILTVPGVDREAVESFYREVLDNEKEEETIKDICVRLKERRKKADKHVGRYLKKLERVLDKLESEFGDAAEIFIEVAEKRTDEGKTITYTLGGAGKRYSTTITYEGLKELLFRTVGTTYVTQ